MIDVRAKVEDAHAIHEAHTVILMWSVLGILGSFGVAWLGIRITLNQMIVEALQ